jgi:uncharacterized protein
MSDIASTTATEHPPLPGVGSPLAPVGEAERLLPVDTLRGLAVLGILMMNIVSFALPIAAMMTPASQSLAPYAGEFTGLNRAVWLVQHLLFDMKFMTIFSMLFGAGLVLMAERADRRQGSLAGVYYRRLFWLLVIGLIHAYIFWYGDILTLYALCGLLLYPMRKWRPLVQIVAGAGLLVVPILIFFTMGMGLAFVRSEADRTATAIAAGGTPTARQQEMLETWTGVLEEFNPPAEEVDRQVAAFRGSPAEVLRENARLTFWMHIQMTFMWGLWRVLGLMLIGMALMKLGIFSAVRSTRFYTALVLVGYGLGLPIVALGAWDQLTSNFDPIRQMLIGWHYNYIASIAVSLGHVGLIMLIVKSGVLSELVRRLAAVGRMALTNYLAQTLIATSFFFGWGLGLFAAVERSTLVIFVIAIWFLQLAWSPWWLARFRYGPAEWLWRTLTYMRAQPLRR